MRLTFARILLVSLIVAAVPAEAQWDIYDNGPTDGYTLGWTINFGFAVSDQFTIPGEATVNAIEFAAWLFPGDVLQTVEVSITSSEFGGTSYFDQVVNFTASGCFSNGEGFNVCNEVGSFGYVPLRAGSYWLNLANGVVNNGDPVYWDMNSGPSLSSESSVGTIPSESFTIQPGGPPPPTSPEPGSLLLLGSGALTLLGFLGGLRRR